MQQPARRLSARQQAAEGGCVADIVAAVGEYMRQLGCKPGSWLVGVTTGGTGRACVTVGVRFDDGAKSVVVLDEAHSVPALLSGFAL